MNQEKIGNFIKEQRKFKKLTQAEFAEKLGVTNMAVSKWENGICLPDISLFETICNVLDITLVELIEGKKSQKPTENESKNIKNIIDYSTENNKFNNILSLFSIIYILFSFITSNHIRYILLSLGILLFLISIKASIYKFMRMIYIKIKKANIFSLIIFILSVISTNIGIFYLYNIPLILIGFILFSMSLYFSSKNTRKLNFILNILLLSIIYYGIYKFNLDVYNYNLNQESIEVVNNK